VTQNFKNSNYTIAYELINEPWAGDIYKDPLLLIDLGHADRKNLEPFYHRLHQAIREIDNDTIIFYEPVTWDYLQTGFTSGPGGISYNDRQALSYHFYCALNEQEMHPINWRLCKSMQNDFFYQRLRDIKRLGGGGFLTEFGAFGTQSDNVIEELHYILDQADSEFQSWTYWTYKECQDYQSDGPFYYQNGTTLIRKVKAMSRTYARAIAGVPSHSSFNTSTGVYKLIYIIHKSIRECTEIYLNEELYYPIGISVTIDPPNFATSKLVEENILLVCHNYDVIEEGKELSILINPVKYY